MDEVASVITAHNLSEEEVPEMLMASTVVSSSVAAATAPKQDQAPPSTSASMSTPARNVFYTALIDLAVRTKKATFAVGLSADTVAAAEKAREEGNTAFLARDLHTALSCYARAVTLSPFNLIYRLNRAACLLELGKSKDAITVCKRIVTAARGLGAASRRSRKQAGSAAPAPAGVNANAADDKTLEEAKEDVHTDGFGHKMVIAKAYARIGTAHYRQRKFALAMNSFTLSLRADSTSDTVRRKLKHCVSALQPNPHASNQPGAPQPPDIEDVVSRHEVVGLRTKFKFECTGCGECCRNVDHIFISPADIFRMSRAPNAKV